MAFVTSLKPDDHLTLNGVEVVIKNYTRICLLTRADLKVVRNGVVVLEKKAEK